MPAYTKPPVVIGSHGLFASQQSPKQLALAEKCNLNGIAYFRFDHRGCGRSQGGQADQASFDGRTRDLFKAWELIKDREDAGENIAFFGSSLGGAAVCRVAEEIRPEAMVIFAAPTNAACVMDSIRKKGEFDKFPEAFFERLFFDNAKYLPALTNILIIHGERDSVVPLTEAHKIFKAAREPKKLVVQRDGDHQMSAEIHQRDFLGIAVDWFKKGFERS